MNVAQVIDKLRNSHQIRENLTAWRTIEARPARYGGFPENLDPRLVAGLKQRGMTNLYTHQHDAVSAALAGQDLCVVTPTASGKTLCYNIPVLQRMLEKPEARALYLFPTKALSQDQVMELKETIEELDVKIGTYTRVIP